MAKLNISGDAISRSSLRKVIRAAWEAVEESVNAAYDLITELTGRVTALDTMKRYTAGLYSSILNVQAPQNTAFTIDTEEGDNPQTLQVVVTSLSAAGETLPTDMIEATITDDTTECTLTWEQGLGATGYRVYYKYDSARDYEGYIEISDPETLSLDMLGTLTPDEEEQPPTEGTAGTFVDFGVNAYYTSIGTSPVMTNPEAGVYKLAHPYFTENTVVHTPITEFTNEGVVVNISVTKEDGKLIITTTSDAALTDGLISRDNYTLNVELREPELPE